jgi:hypothetical protein
LVESVESIMMHGLANPKFTVNLCICVKDIKKELLTFSTFL